MRALLLRLEKQGLKIVPYYIQRRCNNPYVDDIEEDYLDRELHENVDGVNEMAKIAIESEDIKMVKKGLCRETQERIGEQGIEEIARHYRSVINEKLKEDKEKKLKVIKAELYDYAISNIPPDALNILTYHDISRHIDDFMRTHPKWVSKEIQRLRTF